MQKIEIHNLGPVDECVIDINNFMVLTGSQASGKSTIAKAIFFARTVKDDIYELILKKRLLDLSSPTETDITKLLKNKFVQLFGNMRTLRRDMSLIYFYSKKTYIKVIGNSGKPDGIYQKNVTMEFSDDIKDFFRSIYCKLDIDGEILRERINDLFHDDYNSIFIPAGRSLITLLTSQLNYLFAIMDDEQKSSIDFCTQKYIERILRIRPLFENGIDGLIEQKRNMSNAVVDQESIDKMLILINDILKGKYAYKDNEEKLYIDEEHFVKINYTSSGQQETVWIFNILLHLIVNNTKAFIILEEPEAHLYPEAQERMIRMLALIANKSCGILLTTHSPYILGSVNNLIYAGKLSENRQLESRVKVLVDDMFYIRNYNAWFLEKGTVTSCIDTSDNDGLIINEVIDGASSQINELYDKLFDIKYDWKGESENDF